MFFKKEILRKIITKTAQNTSIKINKYNFLYFDSYITYKSQTRMNRGKFISVFDSQLSLVSRK